MTLFCLSINAQNKYDKEYKLSYNLKTNTTFILHNNFYYVQHAKSDSATKILRQSSGYMDIKYKVLTNTNDNLSFEIEYLDKRRESYFRNEYSETDYQELKGKKLRYNFSNIGEVSKFENINIELNEENKQLFSHLEEEIIHMMPSLPEYPVKIGDQWETSFGNDREGFENFALVYTVLDEVAYHGYNCLKIIANYKTNESFEVPRNGKTINVNRNDTGHDIYFFAYKEGILISRKSIGDGIIDILSEEDKLIEMQVNNVLYETNIDI